MMTEKPQSLSSPEAQETLRRHKTQVALQIGVPLGVGVLLALALAVAAALSPSVTTQGGSAAVILLALLCLLGGLPVLLALVAAVVVMRKAPQAVHRGANHTQGFLRRVGDGIRRLSDRVASPWVRLEGLRAGWQRLWGQRRR
ncbi:MAG TPA: hypothetical protein G4O04_01415 [Anaerolineae bacterium]|nr:hypothetical protein [Anaerolineae bacterium]HIQ09551.1 hypothetical protein [Anaerolineaceae bacterium]